MKTFTSHKAVREGTAGLINHLHGASELARDMVRSILTVTKPMTLLSDIGELVTAETTSKDAARITSGRNALKLVRYHLEQQFAAQVAAAKVGDTLQSYAFTSRKGVVTVEATAVVVTKAMHEQPQEGNKQAAANRESTQESERNAKLVAQTAEQKDALAKLRAENKALRDQLKVETAARKAAEKALAKLQSELDAMVKAELAA